MIPVISNTILATLVFLLFITPGIISLRILWGSDKGTLQTSNIYSHVVWGTLLAALLYPFFSWLINCFGIHWLDDFHYQTILSSLFSPKSVKETFVVGAYTKETSYITGKSLESLMWPTVKYFLAMNIFAFVFSALAGAILIKLGLDIPKHSIFRFKNEWFYILSDRGQITPWYLKQPKKWNFKRSKTKKYVEAHLLCEINGVETIYRGRIASYLLKESSLECLYLKDVWKTITPSSKPPNYKINIRSNKTGFTATLEDKNASAQDSFNNNQEIVIKLYRVPCDMMMFKYSDIKNFSLHYVQV